MAETATTVTAAAAISLPAATGRGALRAAAGSGSSSRGAARSGAADKVSPEEQQAGRKMREERVPLLGKLVVGGLAGMASTLVIFPLDMIKTRLQGVDPSGKRYCNGAFQCARYIWNKDGCNLLLLLLFLHFLSHQSSMYTILTVSSGQSRVSTED